MGFYNKDNADPNAATAIENYVDNQAQRHPLDVVPYGGAVTVLATVANNANVVLLANPIQGQRYRVHSWGIAAAQGMATWAWRMSEIYETTSGNPIDGHIVNFGTSTLTVDSDTWQVNGTLASGITAFLLRGGGAGGTSVSVWVRFDTVDTPVIR